MSDLILRTIIGACFLARQAGDGEIELDHLLSALDMPVPVTQQPTDGPFLPVPRQDFPLSKAAQTAVQRLMRLEIATADNIRAILIAASGTESR
jgi:hypothetical protein